MRVHLLCFKLFILVIAISFISCDSDSKDDEVILSTPANKVIVGKTLDIDASGNDFDTSQWYLDNVEIAECKNTEICSVRFDEAGAHVVMVRMQVTQASSNGLGAIPLLGSSLGGSEKVTKKSDVTINVFSDPAALSEAVIAEGGDAAAIEAALASACRNERASACSTAAGGAFTVGGTITGLTGTVVLRVSDDQGSEDLTVTENGTFTFTRKLAMGASYVVIVTQQPSDKTCSVGHADGKITADVTTVSVVCSSITYSVGGTLSGLGGDAVILEVILENNADYRYALTLSANGSFTFTQKVAKGGAYAVTVKSQPTGKVCSVSNGTGTASSDITNVTAICSTSAHTIGGTLSGLDTTYNASGTSVVLKNSASGETLLMSANTTFTFATAVAYGASWTVTVNDQPLGQTCSVSNGSGTLTGAVTNISVACSPNINLGDTFILGISFIGS